MNIVFITTEEISDIGIDQEPGYISSLSTHVADLNQNVVVIVPLYNSTQYNYHKLLETFIDFQDKKEQITVYRKTNKNVTHIFIGIYHRIVLKGFDYTEKEGLLFNYAACEIITRLLPNTDIVITDSTSAAVSQIYMKYSRNRAFFKKIRRIHMIDSLKEHATTRIEDLGISDFRDDIVSICRTGGKTDLNRGAIICSDRVLIPSISYGEELKSESREPRYCHIIRQFAFKFKAVSRGIDYNFNDPACDISLKTNYSYHDLGCKSENKLYVQKMLGFEEDKNIPLISMFCKDKSDIDYSLLTAAIPNIMANGAQLVICIEGSRRAADLRKHNYKNSKIIEVNNISTKYRILSGSDIYISIPPSSPTGKEAKIAARYGAVPVIFSTGALKDSITYYDRISCNGNGFTFNTYNSHDMLYTLWDALCMFRNENDHWQKVIVNAMTSDFSMQKNALELVNYISK